MADIVERLANWQPPLGWSMPTIAVDQHSKLMVETIKAITTLRATISRLEGEKSKLREALTDAIDSIEAWGGYASDYFKEKHDLQGDIDRARLALAETGEKP